MLKLHGTQTEKNLMKAFAGESQARNRYTYYASVALKEGYRQIAEIFEETASHEKEHAKRFFKFLEGGSVEITESFPAGVIGSTVENLRAAAMGELHEYDDMYPAFAKTAREEGFESIAKVFESVAIAEKYHEKRFKKMAQQIAEGTVFKKESDTTWKCLNCGYNHHGTEAPLVCPACNHPQAHFSVLCEG